MRKRRDSDRVRWGPGRRSLLTCRYLTSIGIKTVGFLCSRDEPGGGPGYWPGGLRHGGGVSRVCGSCAERGKAHADDAVLLAGRREGARSSGMTREALSTGAACACG